jgi:hypothetical protein
MFLRVLRASRANQKLMILSNIKQYFQQHRSVSLHTLALYFNSEPEAMRGMLGHWIRKGKVRKQIVENCGCNGCSECASSKMEIYEWVA